MEKKYTYKGKELTLRKNSFKPYRVKAMPFIKGFSEYEKSLTEKLQTEINDFLFKNKKVNGYIISANNDGDASKLNEVIAKVLLDNPEYAIKAKELQSLKEYAKEVFLTTDLKGEPSDENSKKLCEIMFDNHQVINHNPQTEKEYDEYLKFIYEVWDVFFSKFSK